jgi:Protein of unknown function (DUF4240)
MKSFIKRLFGFGSDAIPQVQFPNLSASERQTYPMPEEQFWKIIDATTKQKRAPERQCALLKNQLRGVTTDDVVAFEQRFQHLQLRAYNWDVWGATYVVHGGASDDAFEYFMRWLISRGRTDFELVLREPDALGSIIPIDHYEPCEFEEFAYVASQVWQSKTGIDPWQDELGRFPYTGAPPAEQVSGTPFEDSEEFLSKRYPKLWSRFGSAPLG